MNCKYIIKRLPLYIGNDLRGFSKWFINHHLQYCGKCQKEYEQLKSARQLSRKAILALKNCEKADNVWQRIQYKLPRMDTQISDPKQKSWIKYSPAIIGFAVIVIFTIIIKPYSKNSSISESYVVVEEVFQDNVTVMTFETEDPKIKVVWFFQEDENNNGGVI